MAGMQIKHQFTFSETTKAPELTESMKIRIWCNYLLDLVTEEGLPEIFEAIKDVIEFYKDRQPHAPSFYKITTVPAGIGQHYERPVFQISQE